MTTLSMENRLRAHCFVFTVVRLPPPQAITDMTAAVQCLSLKRLGTTALTQTEPVDPDTFLTGLLEYLQGVR